MLITDHQAKYIAHLLTRRFSPDSIEKRVGAVASAQVLSRCEWEHDDYSLRVENLPQKPAGPREPDQAALFGDAAEG